jgi:NADH-quinone oxidoreductase subunit M
MSGSTGLWLLLGFLAAFLVKLAAAPLHTWLPDAHTEAPTAGSVILAGLLLKTGAYGLLRFAVPLFPEASNQAAPVMMILGAASVLYGGLLAFAQSDLKRLVAYTSVSHMGFVLLGVFAFNALAYQGVVIQLLAHGLSTGALFVIAGLLQNRLATRELSEMGGFWTKAPGMGALTLFFVMASLGLPGLGNFVAEFLILIGAWQVVPLWTAIAALGLVASAIYALRIVQRVFYGPLELERPLADLKIREWLVLLPMVILLLWLGLFPQNFIRQADAPLQEMLIQFEGGKNGSTGLQPGDAGSEKDIFFPESKTKLHQ